MLGPKHSITQRKYVEIQENRSKSIRSEANGTSNQ